MDVATEHRLGEQIAGMLAANTTMMTDSEYRQPVSHYIDGDHLKRERDVLFRRQPLIVAASAELARAGDFRTIDIDGVSALIVRQADGQLAAFHNVCRHRGCRVVDEEAGHKATFTCKFHSWVYGTDGSLRHVPQQEAFSGVDRASRALVPLPVAERHGLIWLGPIEGGAIDIEAFLGPMNAILAEMKIAEGGVFRFERYPEQLNWKLVVDTFLELYHVPHLHNKTVGRFIEGRGGVYEQLGKHGRLVAPRKSYDAARHLPAEQRRLGDHIVGIHRVFPNAIVVWQRDHVEFWTAVPDGADPNRCMVRTWLISPERDVRPADREKWEKNWQILRGTVQVEDFPMARTIQQGFHSGAQDHVVFGRNEPGLHDFHASLAKAMTNGAG